MPNQEKYAKAELHARADQNTTRFQTQFAKQWGSHFMMLIGSLIDRAGNTPRESGRQANRQRRAISIQIQIFLFTQQARTNA